MVKPCSTNSTGQAKSGSTSTKPKNKIKYPSVTSYFKVLKKLRDADGQTAQKLKQTTSSETSVVDDFSISISADFNSDGKGISKIAVDNTTNVTDSGYPFQLDSGKHEDGDLQGEKSVSVLLEGSKRISMPEKVLQWLNQMHDADNFEYSIDPQETLKELFNKYPMFKASNTYFHDLFYTEILPGFFEACVWEYSRRIPKDPSLSYWKLECKTIKPFDTTGIDERMVVSVVEGEVICKTNNHQKNTNGEIILVGTKLVPGKNMFFMYPRTHFSLENWTEKVAILRVFVFH